MVYIIPNCDMFQFTRNHFEGVVQIIKTSDSKIHWTYTWIQSYFNTVPNYTAYVDRNDDKYPIKTDQGSVLQYIYLQPH